MKEQKNHRQLVRRRKKKMMEEGAGVTLEADTSSRVKAPWKNDREMD